MTPPLCSRCPRPAWFDFSAGIFLCEHCTNIVLMRARIDSLKGSAEAFSAGSAVADVNARTGASAAAANSVSDRAALHGSTLGRVEAFSDVGLLARPESNSVSPNSRGDNAAALTLAGSQGLGGAAATIRPPSVASPEVGALANNSRVSVTAGAAFPDCIVKNKSAFRVADSSLIQASASSSDILNQPSSVQV